MKRYIFKRILMLIPVLVGVSVITFLLIRLAPGDPAVVLAGEHTSPSILQQIREKYGLDKPLYVQYWIWLKDALRGDFGRSIKSHEFVMQEIWSRFPNTIELTITSMFIAITVGVIAGVISATRQYSIVDYSAMVGALFGLSMPVFWLGIMLMMIFGVFLNWFPISGRLDPIISVESVTNFLLLDTIITRNWEAFKNAFLHIVLPSVALGTIPMAIIARMTRSSMLEVLRQDYIRTERAKGLSERVVIYKHALRNALIPVVTVIGLDFGLLLAGAILTETVFAWPGVGKYAYQAVTYRDYPAVQGVVLFFAAVFVFVNLAVDVLYAYIDPRIHYE